MRLTLKRRSLYLSGHIVRCERINGQLFTSKETARFMAELYNVPDNNSKVSILDAGAGSGILSYALIKRLEQMASIQAIELSFM